MPQDEQEEVTPATPEEQIREHNASLPPDLVMVVRRKILETANRAAGAERALEGVLKDLGLSRPEVPNP